MDQRFISCLMCGLKLSSQKKRLEVGYESGEGQKHRVVKRVGTDRNRVVKTAEDPQQQLCSTSHEKKLLDRN